MRCFPSQLGEANRSGAAKAARIGSLTEVATRGERNIGYSGPTPRPTDPSESLWSLARIVNHLLEDICQCARIGLRKTRPPTAGKLNHVRYFAGVQIPKTSGYSQPIASSVLYRKLFLPIRTGLRWAIQMSIAPRLSELPSEPHSQGASLSVSPCVLRIS